MRMCRHYLYNSRFSPALQLFLFVIPVFLYVAMSRWSEGKDAGFATFDMSTFKLNSLRWANGSPVESFKETGLPSRYTITPGYITREWDLYPGRTRQVTNTSTYHRFSLLDALHADLPRNVIYNLPDWMETVEGSYPAPFPGVASSRTTRTFLILSAMCLDNLSLVLFHVGGVEIARSMCLLLGVVYGFTFVHFGLGLTWFVTNYHMFTENIMPCYDYFLIAAGIKITSSPIQHWVVIWGLFVALTGIKAITCYRIYDRTIMSLYDREMRREKWRIDTKC